MARAKKKPETDESWTPKKDEPCCYQYVVNGPKLAFADAKILEVREPSKGVLEIDLETNFGHGPQRVDNVRATKTDPDNPTRGYLPPRTAPAESGDGK